MTKKKDPKDHEKKGRPSKYTADHCKQLITLGKKGKLPAQVAAAWLVSKQTLHDWREAHPQFSDAWDIYKQLTEDFLLKLAMRQAGGGKGNFNATKFLLAAAFGYSEKTEIKTDHTSGGQPLAPTITINQPQIRPQSNGGLDDM